MLAPAVEEPVTVIVSTNSCLHLLDVEPISNVPSAFGLSALIMSATNSTPSVSASPTLTLPFRFVWPVTVNVEPTFA